LIVTVHICTGRARGIVTADEEEHAMCGLSSDRGLPKHKQVIHARVIGHARLWIAELLDVLGQGVDMAITI
jgi:hypothetical protein